MERPNQNLDYRNGVPSLVQAINHVMFAVLTFTLGNNEYFLTSGDKVRFFFDEPAVSKDKTLKYPVFQEQLICL